MTEDIRNLARVADFDRYISSLFLSENLQPHVWALLSFVGDVAAIPQKVSETAIGEIRLQWWHDTLAAFSNGSPQDHPIAEALRQTVLAHNLPIEPLQALVDARRFDLYADRPKDWNEVEGYLGETESIVFQYVARICSPEHAKLSADASGLAGVAFGMARTTNKAKLLPEGETDQTYATRLQQRLSEAQSVIEKLPPELFGAYLPMATAKLYVSGKSSNWRRQWAIWRAARREKF
jgi:15-cis-phytoene synthase